MKITFIEGAGDIEGKIAHGGTSVANEKQARAGAARLFTLPPKTGLCRVVQNGLTFVAILHFIEAEEIA